MNYYCVYSPWGNLCGYFLSLLTILQSTVLAPFHYPYTLYKVFSLRTACISCIALRRICIIVFWYNCKKKWFLNKLLISRKADVVYPPHRTSTPPPPTPTNAIQCTVTGISVCTMPEQYNHCHSGRTTQSTLHTANRVSNSATESRLTFTLDVSPTPDTGHDNCTSCDPYSRNNEWDESD